MLVNIKVDISTRTHYRTEIPLGPPHGSHAIHPALPVSGFIDTYIHAFKFLLRHLSLLKRMHRDNHHIYSSFP